MFAPFCKSTSNVEVCPLRAAHIRAVRLIYSELDRQVNQCWTDQYNACIRSDATNTSMQQKHSRWILCGLLFFALEAAFLPLPCDHNMQQRWGPCSAGDLLVPTVKGNQMVIHKNVRWNTFWWVIAPCVQYWTVGALRLHPQGLWPKTPSLLVLRPPKLVLLLNSKIILIHKLLQESN